MECILITVKSCIIDNMKKIYNYLMAILLLLTVSCSKNIFDNLILVPDEIPNVRIHSAASGLGPCEPSICIDPTNIDHIVAGSVLDNVYVSWDGGVSWDKSRLTSPYGVYGDPVIRIGPDSKVYYAHLSNPTGKAYQSDSFLDRIVVQRSLDGGKTWNEGTFPEIHPGKDQDKQWTFIDPASGNILMSWTEFDKYGSEDPEDKSRILFSQSDDQGLTWSKPVTISQYEGDCIDDDNTTEGAVPVVDEAGDYYIAWAFNEKIYFDRSLDKGKSWLTEDKVIADQVNGWSIQIPGIGRCNGMPVTAVDHSQGAYRGRLYVNWSDQRNGDEDTDIWLISSDDGGENWTDPVRVNDDPPGKHQFFSWMDVDPVTGVVYIVFYDRRNHSGNATDVYLAYSTDGGNTFVNIKISETPFTPRPHVFFGDYNDISAFNNKVRPIWTRHDRFGLSVYTAIVDMNGR